MSGSSGTCTPKHGQHPRRRPAIWISGSGSLTQRERARKPHRTTVNTRMRMMVTVCMKERRRAETLIIRRSPPAGIACVSLRTYNKSQSRN